MPPTQQRPDTPLRLLHSTAAPLVSALVPADSDVDEHACITSTNRHAIHRRFVHCGLKNKEIFVTPSSELCKNSAPEFCLGGETLTYRGVVAYLRDVSLLAVVLHAPISGTHFPLVRLPQRLGPAGRLVDVDVRKVGEGALQRQDLSTRVGHVPSEEFATGRQPFWQRRRWPCLRPRRFPGSVAGLPAPPFARRVKKAVPDVRG